MQRCGSVRYAVVAACLVIAGIAGATVQGQDQTPPGGLQYSTLLGGSSEETGSGITVGPDGSAYLIGWTGSANFPSTMGAMSVPWDVFVTKLDPTGTQVLYSSILGGSRTDWGYNIALDSSGNAYVTGHTDSTDFPTTAGAYDRTLSGFGDAYVAKLDSSGVLVYSTLLGGSGAEVFYGIAVDGAGSAYVTGMTQSANFPTTPGAYDTSHNGGDDAILAKLDPTGSTLAFSTYLGGTNPDYAYAIAVDPAGSSYILGLTSGASNFPTSAAAFDRTFNGGFDAFVTKFDAAGAVMEYSTLLGGNGSEERVYGIAVDQAGHAYAVGETRSGDFPITAEVLAGPRGGSDVFVTKLHPTGSSLVYSTRVGGSHDDYAYGVAVDATGHAYVTGHTFSVNFPTTPGAHDRTHNGASDVYVFKLNPGGSALDYSTYVGTEGYELGRGLALDDSGKVYVIGSVNSEEPFPTTPNAYDTTPNGTNDVFAFKLNPVAYIRDLDDDGVTDDVDNCTGMANPDQADRDGDGRGDACERDRDGDTIADDLDICPAQPNPDQADTDGDGTGDACEPDTDGDSVIDDVDNCAAAWNPDQSDANGDGIGDVCQPPPDMDGDRVPDAYDNCVTEYNPSQTDADEDGIGDACQFAPDTDGDAASDDWDNCPAVFNPDQADLDGDGAGDECDTDRDGDGIDSHTDNCPLVSNPDQADADGDFTGDVCDPSPLPPPFSHQLSLVTTVAGDGIVGDFILAVDDRANLVYAMHNRHLRVIDGRTSAVIDEVMLPFPANSIAVDPVAHRLFLTDRAAGQVRWFDGGSLVEQGSTPGVAVAVNPVSRRAYIGLTDAIQVFDAATMDPIETVTQSAGQSWRATRLVVDEIRNRVFFNDRDGAVWVLDGTTHVVSQTPIANIWRDLAVLGEANAAYWVMEEAGSLNRTSLTDGSTQMGTEFLARSLDQFEANQRVNRIYAMSSDEDYVYDFSVVDADLNVLAHFSLPGDFYQALAINQATGRIYAGRSDGAIAVVEDAGAKPADNTPAGTNVEVRAEAVQVTFENIVAPGVTSIAPIDPASLDLTLPGAFAISASAPAVEITTTATFAGGIKVCLSGASLSEAEFASAVILHGVNDAWQPETTQRNAATRELCATVQSLSPFAVGIVVDRVAPEIRCAAADGAWHTQNVAVACTAADAGAGLQSTADHSFTLTTNVSQGGEDANAATGSRTVCDKAGNCATAGPIAGHKIDMRAPVVQIASPTARRYLLNQAVVAAYTCTDGGTVTSCAGPVASGAAVATGVAGAQMFAVHARDAAGNTAAASVAYVVGYGVHVLFDQTTLYRAGQVPLRVALQDAAGTNVSSAQVALIVRRMTRVAGSGTPYSVDVNFQVPFDARTRTYGGDVRTSKLPGGTYTVEFTAGADPEVHQVTIRIK